jgi:hypothetical protein
MGRENDERESRRIIDRVGAETEASMAKRAQDHMAGRDADENDWVEVWGTRIGRWLGLLLLVYILWSLFDLVARNG